MPTDPVILLSFVNMKLRDQYGSLEDLCRDYGADQPELTRKLWEAGYVYHQEHRQFVPRKGEST